MVVGGDPEVFARCRPILDALTERVRHVGPNGAGARAKLVVNLVLGLNRLALAEGLLFGLRQGLDGHALLAVLKESGAYSRAMDLKGARMVEGRFEAEGKLAQHLKDVELMLEVGHAAGAPLLATALHRQLLLAGVAGGLGDHDNSAIIAVLRSLVERTALKSARRGRARSAILGSSSLEDTGGPFATLPFSIALARNAPLSSFRRRCRSQRSPP